jgi:hypothetical protein
MSEYSDSKRVYLQMARREKVGSPELKAFDKEKRAGRKRAKLKEEKAKELADIQLEARRHTADILKEMVDIATSEIAMDTAKIAAAHFVYDRAYGKAAQTNINANVNSNGKPSEITGSALAKRIEAALKRVEELTGRGATPPTGEERPADLCQHNSDPDSSTRH